MMRLPAFHYRAPRTLAEAATLLSAEGPSAMLLAGGTDLFPNMKRRQQTPATVIALRQVAELHGVRRDGDGFRIGAMSSLSDLVNDRALAESAPALHRAAAQVATAHLRNAATLGGNICLDTRCTYYDQSYEWREAIGFCMKKDGQTCWVATSSPKCLAVSSTDSAPALIALGAEVDLVSERGPRRLPLSELYQNDGMHYLVRRPDEILSAVHVPSQSGWRSTYWKLRRRGSIDFPVLGVAAAVKLDGRGGVIDARLVLGAVSSRPLVATEARELLLGRELTDDVIEAAAESAAKLAKPMDNTDYELHWRKGVASHFVAGILRQMRGDDPATLPPLARRAALAVA